MENKLLFNKYYKGKHWVSYPTNYSEQFSKFLKKHNFNGLLVDIGCGEGKDVNVFYKNGFNILGIDKSQEEIIIAKEKYSYCNFKLQDAENLKFKDNYVSSFFIINVIHYTKMEKVMKEIYRTLKKGGYLFIHFNISITDNKGNVDYEHKENEIEHLVSDFKVVEKRIIKRSEKDPIPHTHKIMELILMKI